MKKITFTSALIISIFFSFQYTYGSISILSHTPTINALNISPSANITVQFNTAINTVTLTNSTIRVYGEESGLHHSVITYNSSTNTATINPDQDFKPGEKIQVISTKGIKSTANDSLANPLVWQFNIGVAFASVSFVLDTIITSVVSCSGVIFCDFDNDGDLDAAHSSHNEGTVTIFKNNGGGRFSTFFVISGGGLGWGVYGPSCGDFNTDGFTDLAIPSRFGNVISIWFNNGDGTFTNVQQVPVNLEPQQSIPGDFNGDGYLDLAACCNNSGSFFYDILINDGTGHFTRTQQIPIPERPDYGSLGDVDNDGDLDLVVSDLPNAGTSSEYLLINNGNAVFSIVQIPIINTGNFPGFGDIDNDGDLDIITAGSSVNSNWGMRVLKNNGSGGFTETQAFGNSSENYITKGFIDLNNDGYLDLVTINTTAQYQRDIFYNDGSGNFTFAYTIPNWTNSAPNGFGVELDGDGVLDMGGGNNGNFAVYRGISPPPPPPVPVLVSPLNNSTGLPLADTLRWNISSGAISYRLQAATDAGFTALVVNDSTLTTNSKFVSGLAPLTTYYWRVNAKNSAGTSAWSASWNFRTIGTAGQVTLIIPANNSVNIPTTQIFRWSKAFDQTTKLLVSNYWFEMVSDTVTMANLLRDSTLTDTLRTVTGMNSNTIYYWRVKAKNQIGWGNFTSRFKFTTVPPVPAAPTLIAPANNSTNISVIPLLDWTFVPLTASYQVQVAKDSGFTTMVLDSSNITVDSLRMPAGKLVAESKYYWRVRGQNISGTGPYSIKFNFTTRPVGVNQLGNEVPKIFKLYNNYPNPFNPVTVIRFDLPINDFVVLKIYNLLGSEVAALIDENMEAGTYEVNWDGSNISSGIYFYVLKTRNLTDNKKMVLIK